MAAQCGGLQGGARAGAVDASAKYVVPSPEVEMAVKMKCMAEVRMARKMEFKGATQ